MTLAASGWSQRRIAQELGVHRETVGRHLRLEDSKPAKVPAGILPRSRSQCESWRDWIEQGALAGLTAQRIYQDLVREHQYAGSYDAVKRFVRRMRQICHRPVFNRPVTACKKSKINLYNYLPMRHKYSRLKTSNARKQTEKKVTII